MSLISELPKSTIKYSTRNKKFLRQRVGGQQAFQKILKNCVPTNLYSKCKIKGTKVRCSLKSVFHNGKQKRYLLTFLLGIY